MNDRLALLADPQLRGFLPLLYVAWADGDLEQEQRAAIRARLDAEPWLRPAARNAVEHWLEPTRPPNARELAAVRLSLTSFAWTGDQMNRAT